MLTTLGCAKRHTNVLFTYFRNYKCATAMRKRTSMSVVYYVEARNAWQSLEYGPIGVVMPPLAYIHETLPITNNHSA